MDVWFLNVDLLH